MLIICFTLKTNVYAETATFYEGEYIDNIYMSKYNPSNDTVYYQTARFFRKSDTNEFAYCIEPLRFFEDNSTYESTLDINSLLPYQKEKIKKIAHFGYQYKNHTDAKWYAITQMMIWRVADLQGDFYFTDTLNGNRIEPYQEEMNEIEYLISQYDILPVNEDYVYEMLDDSDMAITSGTLVNYYTCDSDKVLIRSGRIIVKHREEGYYEYELIRKEDFNNPTIFYQSNNSQTLIKTGDLPDKKAILKVAVHRSKITIHKQDEETEDTPQGDASLDGAIFGLYDELEDTLIQKVEITNNEISIEGIEAGPYYIQEISPGEGYLLNEEKYSFTIDNKNYNIDITSNNKVIKKNIKIVKKYGEENNLQAEPNITFEIYNSKNELIDTKTTNENGEIELTLVYGTYSIKQINTTEGYEKIEDYLIEVKDQEDETIEFMDYKVEVPNTYTKEKSFLTKLLEFLLFMLC